MTGRSNDGENCNCVLIVVTDTPYKHQLEAMTEIAKRLFEVHSGSLELFDRSL